MDLRLDHVSFSYPGGFTLSDISLDVPTGSFLGLIGPNGSGKSTLLGLMSGALRPAAGMVLLDRKPLAVYGARELARRLAVVSADSHFDFPFPVREVVEMGRFPHRGRLQGIGRHDSEAITRALQATDLVALEARPISQLSTGERQRALIARGLAQEPAVMLFDEPDAHLDLHHQLNIFRLLRRLNRERNITTVVVLHDLTAAGSFCRELALLDAGRLVAFGQPERVITSDIIRRVYGPGIAVRRNPVGRGPLVTIDADTESEPETDERA
jgi:iron complex transport system ATP-binding protein